MADDAHGTVAALSKAFTGASVPQSEAAHQVALAERREAGRRASADATRAHSEYRGVSAARAGGTAE
jgi:hypothetical protein